MLVCCQVTFLILICLMAGFLIGIWLSQDQNIRGLPDLWSKFVELFQNTKKNLGTT